MKISALKSFVCPIDGGALLKAGQSLRCESGHVYDVSAEGYCNLLLVQQKASLEPGDSKEMVKARGRFLDGGYFASISNHLFKMVCDIVTKIKRDAFFRIVDAGCGDGYYLYQLSQLAKASIQKESFELAGCDISKWAVKAAAKRSSEIGWAVAGNRQLPFAPGGVDIILSMFGYPDWENFKTVLPFDGRLLLIDPGPDHLIELRKMIYPEVNLNELRSLKTATDGGYVVELVDQLKYSTNLENHSSIEDLLKMTPHAYRITHEAREKLRDLKQLSVTVDVMFRVLRKGE